MPRGSNNANDNGCKHDHVQIVSREVSYYGYDITRREHHKGRWHVAVAFQDAAWEDETAEVSQWLTCADCGWVVARNPKITWTDVREDW